MAWSGTAAEPLEADAGFEELPYERSERVIVGRQGIRDRDLTVVGYELLTAFVEAPVPTEDDDEHDDRTDYRADYLDDDEDAEQHEYLPASVCTSAAGIGPLVG